MGAKYEIQYYDYENGVNLTKEYTNSLFRAIYLLHKLEKKYYCVTIRFRRDKVKIR